MADSSPTATSAHSAAVYRYAVELVEDTRRNNENRLADARDLAAVVRIADEPAADRILGAAEEACARDLHIAEQQAEEVVRHARSGIMAAVQRYAASIVEDARSAGQARLDKATELAELIRLADSNSADRLLQAIHTVNEAAMRTAERQSHSVLEAAQTRLTISGRVPDGGNPRSTNPGSPVPATPEPTTVPASTTANPDEPASDYADPLPAPIPSYYHMPLSNGAPGAAEPGTSDAAQTNQRPEES